MRPTHSSRTILHFIFLFLCFFAFQSGSAQQQALVSAVDAIGMTVDDMDRSVDFYSQVLSFTIISDREVWGEEYEHLQGVFGLRMRVVRMKLGDEFIELTEYLAPKGNSYPLDTKSNDSWFQHIAIVVRDMEQAYQHLRKHKARHASTGPQRLPDWNKNAGGIKAFYFRDPDGHFLEIIWFPEGKGDLRWQKPDKELFLGIDHTAIVVSNTEESLKFYRDVLGLQLAGESENYGTEQEHLNNVFGARLRISGLRAVSGPGIEFLEYLSPRTGRRTPVDIQANDVAHWQTLLVVDDANATEKRLRAGGATFVSPGAVVLPEGGLVYRNGLLVREADGHALLLREKEE